MYKFISLTGSNSNENIVINADQICIISDKRTNPSEKDKPYMQYTEISMSGGHVLTVKETIKEIYNKIYQS